LGDVPLQIVDYEYVSRGYLVRLVPEIKPTFPGQADADLQRGVPMKRFDIRARRPFIDVDQPAIIELVPLFHDLTTAFL
jgi:hypothetical protein